MSDEVVKLSDEAKALAELCNEKHVRVVQAILSGDFDSNMAAYLSVYPDAAPDSARAAVSALLTIHSVKALYEQLKEEKLLEGVMSRAEAMKRLSDMARVDMSDLVSFGPKVVQERNQVTGEIKDVEVSTWDFHRSDELTPEAVASISEIASSKEGVKLKIHDAKAAIRQLAEMAGWNSAKEIKLSGSLKRTDESMGLEEATRIYEDNLKRSSDE